MTQADGQTAAPKDIHAAIAAVYRSVAYVQKSRSKEGGVPYSFAGESALIEAIRPALVEAGIYMHVLTIGEPFREAYTTKNGTAMNRTAVHVTVRFMHISGTFIDVQAVGEGSDSGDKSHAKALTGAYKYALRETFCIETGDDPDHAGSQLQERAPTKKRPVPINVDPETGVITTQPPAQPRQTASKAATSADTPTCETCFALMRWQQGEKDGKRWRGWFCKDYKRGQEGHPVIWAKVRPPVASRPIDAIPTHEQQAAYEADEDAARAEPVYDTPFVRGGSGEVEVPDHPADPWPPFWASVEAIGEGLMHPDAAFVLGVAQARDLATLKDSLRSASVRSKAKGGKAPREVADLLGDLLLRVGRAWAAQSETLAEDQFEGDPLMPIGPSAPVEQGRMA